MSNAIVPYQAPQSRGTGNNERGYNSGGYNGGSRNSYGGNGGGYNNQQRVSHNWGGNRDREYEEKFDKIYGLLTKQAEEREQRKREADRLLSLEEEKKRLQAEELKRAEAKNEREQQEARLCEWALGRKVDLPGDEESEVAKLRKELDALKASCAGGSKETELEALRREKDSLLRAQDIGSEEDRLRKEIAELKSCIGQQQLADSQKEKDEIPALKIQIAELSGIRKALEDKSTEVAFLQKENSHLRSEFNGLKEEISRTSPSREEKRCDATKKTTPRNLKTAFESVDIDSDDEREDAGKEADPTKSTKGRSAVDDAQELEVTKMEVFREKRLRELRVGKKNDLEKLCQDEGISYIKLDQAKADVAEIRARRDFDEWLRSRTNQEEEDRDQHYSTFVEEANEG
ncbi:hypothetical protein CBR_g55048 [Chara braunii]|uniref:Uncharacterized protein n=1 Tax=Chara braunii TaxID=69332 RepID=A0A388MCT6_CHABU|nr:hypothetical protein CBR_g55048 [Chara braunii]|eukprot:GBG92279.1 hypothetical protein CBR_g55048 [Chara braunii]